MSTNERLVPVFVPALAEMLLNREREKGSPLTEQEVLALRGSSVCMMMAESRAARLAELRGYPDIDPENCWDAWCVFRKAFEPRL